MSGPIDPKNKEGPSCFSGCLKGEETEKTIASVVNVSQSL